MAVVPDWCAYPGLTGVVVAAWSDMEIGSCSVFASDRVARATLHESRYTDSLPVA